eukprot:gene12126-14831_t
MAKVSKRVAKVREGVDREKLYDLTSAVAMVKERAIAKFDETIEVSMNLGVDPRHADQMVRGVVNLPNGTGRTVRVAVFARGDKAEEAKKAGADIVGAEDLFEIVNGGKIDFDRCIATPDMMPLVGRLGKVLGPRGMMPNPKVGTVTTDVTAAVKASKGGAVEFRVEKAGIVHAGVGKASFDVKALEENIKAFTDAVTKAKPAGAKGEYVKRVAISSTMGVGVKVDPSTAFRGLDNRMKGGKIHRDKVRTVVAFRLQPDFRRSRGDRILKCCLVSVFGLKPCDKRQPGRDAPCVSAKWRETVEKAEKREFVTWLNGVFKDSGSVVVAHYTGLTVAQLSDLRSKMRDAGGTVKVAKNRLAKIALQGTESEGISDLFTGQTLVAYSNDPITAPKIAIEFAKGNEKLVILGGSMGATTLDADGVKALAALPSLDELRAKLVGMIQTPATRIAQIVNAPAGQLARVFGAYARKDEAA